MHVFDQEPWDLKKTLFITLDRIHKVGYLRMENNLFTNYKRIKCSYVTGCKESLYIFKIIIIIGLIAQQGQQVDFPDSRVKRKLLSLLSRQANDFVCIKENPIDKGLYARVQLLQRASWKIHFLCILCKDKNHHI